MEQKMKGSREEKERQEDLKMIKNPLSWPQWPLLPMKKIEKTKNNYEYGFMIATGKPIVYLINMFDIPEKGFKSIKEIEEKVPSKIYSNYENMLDDGWIID